MAADPPPPRQPSPSPSPPPPRQAERRDEADAELFVEVDPTGRYGRYREVLGKGAFKTVYKAFDELEGIEVAWNQIKMADVLRNVDDLERLKSEVHLLKTLKHKNIIKFYNSWVDTKHDNINFITEVFTSGTLRQYRNKHKHVDLRALKKWSRQILSGLLYLHSHDPPVIHRDLKCDNIFVNGNHGEVKIGDLGLAAILCHAHSARSVIGTPEFMAPELYEEEYNELVDIYAFGMCLLELVTFEYPYSECTNAAQIFKKVTTGAKPASLAKVQDPEVRIFIEKCIADVSERLSARELLMDRFLQLDGENEQVGHFLPPNINHSDNAANSKASTSYMHDREEPSTTSRDFTVEGQRKDMNTIFLKLRIADSTGQIRNIHFPFDIEADTSFNVATEMVSELDLTDQDVTAIAAMIDAEIQAYIPEWLPGEALDDNGNEDDNRNEETISESHNSEADDIVSALPNEPEALPPSGGLVLERLPSGRRYWSNSPRGTSEGSPSAMTQSNVSSDSNSHTNDDSPFVVDDENQIAHKDIHSPEDNFEMMSSAGYLVFRNPSSSDAVDINGEDLLEDESKEVRYVAEKLVYLLLEQQRELNELRKKHEKAIHDVLKELPPELHEKTLNRCRLKLHHNKV